MKKNALSSMVLIAFLLVSCGTSSGNNGYIVPQQINDPQILERTPIIETQIERVNNGSLGISVKTADMVVGQTACNLQCRDKSVEKDGLDW